MNCREARDLLTSPTPPSRSATLGEHLKDCGSCGRYAARLAAAREMLREHGAQVEPGAGFAARVTAALPSTPELLGWAALRLLPATLALAVVLAGWCLVAAPSPGALLEEGPSDDLLAWTLDLAEEVEK